MEKNIYIDLTTRTVIEISGEDSRDFLQGLITNDINNLDKENSIYALMLTPQGKFLYDFFIYKYEEKILLDCDLEKIDEIKKKLSMYKLRSKVIIENAADKYKIIAVTENLQNDKLKIYSDPRSCKLPLRIITAEKDNPVFDDNNLRQGSFSDYEKLRILNAIPSDKDMGFNNSFPLDYGMDNHNAIDYKKGCYVGQEVTARMHYKGKLKKKPYIVESISGEDIIAHDNTDIISGTSKVGIINNSCGNIAIALLRVDDLEKAESEMMAGKVGLRLR